MAEGLTYMIVDPETGQGVEQTATSLMAVEGGDGKQQFAVPVMDPETGQQTYMLLDQEQLEAQNIHITSEGEGENQQFMIVNSEGDGLQQMVEGEAGQEQGYAMVEGGQEVMVMVEGQCAVMAQVGEGGQVVNMGNGEEKEGFSSEALEWESKLRADGTEAANAKEEANDPSYVIGGDFEAAPVKKQPRKQNLVIVHPDYSSGKDEEEKVETPGKYYPKHPPGLSGNIEQDKKVVDKKVEEICMSVDMTSREIDQLRVSLMTRGLTAHAITGATTAYSPGRGARSSYVRAGYMGVGGRGGRGRGRGRPPIVKPPREIKCDKCGKAFPRNVDESVLVHHVKTFHLNPKKWACTKCDKVLASEMALKYHTCSDTKFKCQDCNKLFMQKSTLMEHMAVAHGPVMEKSPEKPEIRKVLEQDWDDDEEEDVDDPKAQNGSSQEESKETNEEGMPPRTIVMNAKVVEDFETEGSEKSQVQKSESVPKEDEDDEDKIVADVDDILNDTDRLVGNLKDIVDDKRKTSVIRKRKDFSRGPADVKDPTSAKAAKISPPKAAAPIEKPKISTKQCETCYELFETDEKLAWHDLHVHAPPAIKPEDDL